jgi:hypothetical protein
VKNSVLPNHFLEKMAPADRKPLGRAGLTVPEAQAKFVARAEKEMHRDYENWLNLRSLLYAHVPMNRPSSLPPGHPDFAVYYCGHVLLADFKVPGGTLKDSQKVWFAHAELIKSPVRIWYSAGEAIQATVQWMVALQKEHAA